MGILISEGSYAFPSSGGNKNSPPIAIHNNGWAVL
jgi:hypothetical protein